MCFSVVCDGTLNWRLDGILWKTKKATVETWNLQSLLKNFGINLSRWRICSICKILSCKCYCWCIPQCFNTDTAPLNLLKSLGPSNIEIELRCLAPEGGGSMEVMLSFLRMIGMMLNKKYNFELAQAYLALFLKVTIFLQNFVLVLFKIMAVQ